MAKADKVNDLFLMEKGVQTERKRLGIGKRVAGASAGRREKMAEMFCDLDKKLSRNYNSERF